jgi:hypothetical protein
MTYITVPLSKKFKHRYKFIADIYNTQKNNFQIATVFLDTGCFNTMIPRDLAKQTGRSLGFKKSYSIGGSLIETEAYAIKKIKIGDFSLERVIAFAGDYKGSNEEDIILGTNVLNNWDMNISKKEHKFHFCENPPDDIPNKINIYQNYFNRDGDYTFVQDN